MPSLNRSNEVQNARRFAYAQGARSAATPAKALWQREATLLLRRGVGARCLCGGASAGTTPVSHNRSVNHVTVISLLSEGSHVTKWNQYPAQESVRPSRRSPSRGWGVSDSTNSRRPPRRRHGQPAHPRYVQEPGWLRPSTARRVHVHAALQQSCRQRRPASFTIHGATSSKQTTR